MPRLPNALPTPNLEVAERDALCPNRELLKPEPERPAKELPDRALENAEAPEAERPAKLAEEDRPADSPPRLPPKECH